MAGRDVKIVRITGMTSSWIKARRKRSARRILSLIGGAMAFPKGEPDLGADERGQGSVERRGIMGVMCVFMFE
jgi:hypothetical protein